MSLQRRRLLAAAAATPLLSFQPAGAQQAQTPAQAPGFYRFRVGHFLVTAITDGQAMRANPTGQSSELVRLSHGGPFRGNRGSSRRACDGF